MQKSPQKPKSRTRSQPLRSTKKSKGSTRTSKIRSHATELFSQSMRPKVSVSLQEAVVEGFSMWPALRAGFRVKFRHIDPEGLSPGDILVLKSRGRRGEERLKVHRFLGRIGPLFLEAGDNAFSSSLVSATEILGKVEEIRDWDGNRISLPPYLESEARFQFFRLCAKAFVYTHEVKDRLVGDRRSFLLWQASKAYRAGLGILGLSVPVISPK